MVAAGDLLGVLFGGAAVMAEVVAAAKAAADPNGDDRSRYGHKTAWFGKWLWG